MSSRAKVRRSLIAGTWYPGSAARLGSEIDSYLAQSPRASLPGEPVGLIAPHAGYAYSGQVAAQAYKQVQGADFDRAVIISPIHRVSLGRYAITDHSHYETPLGLVEIDSDEDVAHDVLPQMKRILAPPV